MRFTRTAPVSRGLPFDAGAPLIVFDARLREVGVERVLDRQYAVSRDGSKFLLNRSVEVEGTRPMSLVYPVRLTFTVDQFWGRTSGRNRRSLRTG
jgi:hypothetical protein